METWRIADAGVVRVRWLRISVRFGDILLTIFLSTQDRNKDRIWLKSQVLQLGSIK
jgi:hypothetical protein